jgi:hypothetical protein
MAEFICPPGKYCSDQQATEVGDKKTKIYHRTVTTLTGEGPAYTGAKTETYIIKPKPGGPTGTLDQYVLASTTTDGGKTQTYTSEAGEDFKKSMGPGGNIAKNTQAQVQTTLSAGKGRNALGQTGDVLEKITPEQQKKVGVISPSVSTSNPTAAGAGGNATATATQVQQLIDNAGTYKGRKKYPEENLKYPVNMNAKLQDCMKFQIIQYVPSKLGIGAQDTTLRTSASKNKNQNILTTITLPMPSGGITDRNSVDWGSSQLNPVEAAFADTAMAMIAGGGEAGANAAGKNLQAATANKDVTTALIAIKASEAALGGTGLLSRVAGLAVDSSLELLFNGPSLREFSFSFKMTPRSKNEAQMVRSIIRTFKQAMSVKRSESVLLLKSPHTFRISYLTSTKDHPYLNRFKECALTNCSVNYTPDGQYMSYDDSSPDGRSMTAYELSLSFNELEPIFDDDYETMEGAKGSFNHIGY